ncbi:hypothetical protein QYM36_016215 [Artemia franciscana]|uniref:Uncharacterized protein n=1 Tax=Artemia franciscana TaxID=6661 RepID=A0AA88H9F5_ARTSF|nr:hypothetical protein QYM36_016215 [Artemia franciscana]
MAASYGLLPRLQDFQEQFSEEEERQLLDYCTAACAMHHSLARSIGCKIAYEFAAAKTKTVPKSLTNERTAGRELARSFLA